MNQNKSLLLQSMNDFLTPKMLKYALMPFVITIVVLYVLFFVMAGMGLEQLGTLSIQSSQTTMQNGVTNTENMSAMLQGSAIIQFL
ncbi:MAG: EI24 domain-containing protein, partial [Sulfurimonas sp.]|nr:EI24 domain-containing protein [Sulfurimonas sp.]